MLYTPAAHEALTDARWSAGAMRTAIASIAADAAATFDDGWALHPEDEDGLVGKPHGLYLGGAGVVAALHRLEQRGYADPARDYVPYLERACVAGPDFAEESEERSLWMGELGVRLVLQRLAPAESNRRRMADLIAANEQDERCEVMWGSPGSILAARELGLDVTSSVDWLRGKRDADGVWTQRLGGREHRMLGPAHGFAGCVLALDDADGVTETLERFAVVEDGLANWSPLADGGLVDANRDGIIRMQWCHGAPGMVATLAPFAAEKLLLAGAELTWLAGPLGKGGGLCHGTAGNGYAFLAVFARTGDELWLARARAFAMHAAQQVERARDRFGRGRHTLWSGDLGTAVYLADCIDAVCEVPLP